MMNSRLAGEIQSTSQLTQAQKNELITRLRSQETGVDAAYLNALYFPDSSPNARVPSKFGVPSSLFSQRMNFYMKTGNDGNGLIVFAPQDITACPILVKEGGNWASAQQQTATQDFVSGIPLTFMGDDSRYINENWSQVRLVGASIRLSWIGNHDEESGFITGSHVYNATPFTLNEEIIEEGYMPVRGRPHEGVRMVWMPRDEEDLEYCPSDLYLDTLATEGAKGNIVSTSVNAQNWFMQPDTNETSIEQDNALAIKVKSYGTGNGSIVQYAAQDLHHKSPSYYWGLMNDREKHQNPNLLCIYWRGLPQNKEWFRIDVERHFEGIPRQHLNNVVSTSKPVYNKKTLDHVGKISEMPGLHSSKLQHAEMLETHVKPNTHLIPDLKQIAQTEATDIGAGAGIGGGIGTALGGLVGLITGGPGGAAAGATTGGALGTALGTIGGGIMGAIEAFNKPQHNQSYNDPPKQTQRLALTF